MQSCKAFEENDKKQKLNVKNWHFDFLHCWALQSVWDIPDTFLDLNPKVVVGLGFQLS